MPSDAFADFNPPRRSGRLAKIAGAACGLVGLGIFGMVLAAPVITIEIPEETVQTEIAAKLPIAVDQAGAQISVTAAKVDFLDSNAAHITAMVDYRGFGVGGTAIADVTSSLRYEAGRFYLDEVSLDDVKTALDAESAGRVDDAKTLAKGFFDRARERLAAGDAKAGAALDRFRDAALNQITPLLEGGIEKAIRDIPIYDLTGRDLKHSLAAAALKDVTFTDTGVIVSLDPAQLMLKILGMIAIGAMALLGAIGLMFSRGGLAVAAGASVLSS